MACVFCVHQAYKAILLTQFYGTVCTKLVLPSTDVVLLKKLTIIDLFQFYLFCQKYLGSMFITVSLTSFIILNLKLLHKISLVSELGTHVILF